MHDIAAQLEFCMIRQVPLLAKQKDDHNHMRIVARLNDDYQRGRIEINVSYGTLDEDEYFRLYIDNSNPQDALDCIRSITIHRTGAMSNRRWYIEPLKVALPVIEY